MVVPVIDGRTVRRRALKPDSQLYHIVAVVQGEALALVEQGGIERKVKVAPDSIVVAGPGASIEFGDQSASFATRSLSLALLDNLTSVSASVDFPVLVVTETKEASWHRLLWQRMSTLAGLGNTALEGGFLGTCVHAMLASVYEEHKHPWERKLASDAVAKAVDWISSEPCNPWVVADLADQLHVSRYQFSRVFKQHIGVSPKRFIIQQRCQYAAGRLRREPTVPVAEVAEGAGYPDVCSFSKQFKATMGMSPAQYRRANQS